MAAMLHAIILWITLLLHHTSYGIEINQGFQPEQQDFHETLYSDLAERVNNKDSAKPLRIKDNFKNIRQTDDREKSRAMKIKPEINKDLKKLLLSLIVVLQDLRNTTGDDSPSDQFEESNYEKIPSPLTNMEFETNRNKYGGMRYKGYNEDEDDIKVSSEDYEKDRYGGNIKQWIPPSFDPKITNGMKLFQNVNKESGEFIDDYINYPMINSPKQQTPKRDKNPKYVQNINQVPNSKIYRNLRRKPTAELTGYRPASFNPHNMRRKRPNEPSQNDFSKKQKKTNFTNLDKNRGLVGRYELPGIYYTNVKNIQPILQKEQNFREETNPEDISWEEEYETGNYPKKYSNVGGIEDSKPSRTQKSNSRGINSNQPKLVNSQKEPTEYQNHDKIVDYMSQLKPTSELKINTQNIPANNRKQTILNRDSVPKNDLKKSKSEENITNDEQPNQTNSNPQNIKPNQPDVSNTSDKTSTKKDKHNDEINLSKLIDELSRNTKKVETQHPNLKKNSITEDNPKEDGYEEIINNESSNDSSANSEIINPIQPEISNSPEETNNDKKNSNRKSVTEDNSKGKEKDENKDEPSSVSKTNSQIINPPQNKLSNLPVQLNNEQDNSNAESVTEDNSKGKENEENKDEPSSVSNANSQIKNPPQTKLSNLPQELNNEQNNSNRKSVTEDNLKGKGNEKNKDEQPSASKANSEISNPPQSKPSNPPEESHNEQNNSNKESSTKDNLNDKGKKKNKYEPSTISNAYSVISIPPQSKLSNPPEESNNKQNNSNRKSVTDDNLNDKREDENKDETPNVSNSNSQISSPPKSKHSNRLQESNNDQNNSIRELVTEDNTNYKGNEENKDELSSVNPQNMKSNQLQFTNPPKEPKLKDDQKVEMGLSKTPDETKEPQQTNPNLESIKEYNSNHDGNNKKIHDDKPLSISNVKSKNINPNQTKQSNSSEEPTPEDGQNIDKNRGKINIFKPTDSQNTRTNGAKTTNKNASEKKISNPNSDRRTDDFEYEEDDSEELYKSENDYEDEEIITNFPDSKAAVSSNSQLLKELPKVRCKNESERQLADSKNIEKDNSNQSQNSFKQSKNINQNQPKLLNSSEEPTAKDRQNIHKNEGKINVSKPTNSQNTQTKGAKTTILNKNPSERNVLNSDSNRGTNDLEYEDISDKSFEIDDDEIENYDEDEIENYDEDEIENYDEDEETLTNFPDSKAAVSSNSQLLKDLPKVRNKNEKIKSERQLPDSKTIVKGNSKQSQNYLKPSKERPSVNEVPPAPESEGQTSESTSAEGNENSAQIEPNLSDFKKDVSENLHQSQMSPISNEKEPINDRKSSTSEKGSQANESTTPGENQDSSQNVPNLPGSRSNDNENNQQSQNSAIPLMYSPLKDEKPSVSENESQPEESKTPGEKTDFNQKEPTFPDFEEAIIKNAQEFQNLPVQNGKAQSPSSFKQNSQVHDQGTPGENIQKKVQMVPNFSNVNEALGEDSHSNFLLSDGSSTSNEERSHTSETGSQTNESMKSGEKFDTIVEFLQRYSKNPVFKEIKQKDALFSRNQGGTNEKTN